MSEMKDTPYKTETWLPCFKGFYDTVFLPSENLGDTIEEHSILNDVDEIDLAEMRMKKFDYRVELLEAAQHITTMVHNALEALTDLPLLETKYEQLNSTREYNFTTDAVDVTFIWKSKEALYRYLYDFCKDNQDEFEEYLRKRYTSYEGHTSFYPNESEPWFNFLLKQGDTTNGIDSRHAIGSLLHFLLGCVLDGEEEDDVCSERSGA